SRQRQQQGQARPNAGLQGAALDAHCVLDADGRQLLNQAMRRLHGSARATHRALRVARTIADLDGQERLQARHVAEALQYRCSLR
ncbi:ATP-dependent protease, partial [Bordetella petrii]|nr:ATP-dependent protease [Bordetella petrii]